MKYDWRADDAAALARLAGCIARGPVEQEDYYALLGRYDRDTIATGLKRYHHLYAGINYGQEDQQPALSELLPSIEAVAQGTAAQ